MNEVSEKLAVRIDADLSEFDNKIDAMFERLSILRDEIASLEARLGGAQANAAVAKHNQKPNSSSGKNLEDAVQKVLNNQAAQISR